MKLPNSFRPEGGLDKKTEQLLEESKVINSETKIKGIGPELANILSVMHDEEDYYKQDYFHKDIDDLISKTGYKVYAVTNQGVFNKKNPLHTQWVLPHEEDSETLFLLSRRRYGKKERRYEFAIVDKENIPDFSNKLDTYLLAEAICKKEKTIEKAARILTATLVAATTISLMMGLPNEFSKIWKSFALGCSPIVPIYLGYPCLQKKLKQKRDEYREKLVSLAYEVELYDDRTALEKAFK